MLHVIVAGGRDRHLNQAAYDWLGQLHQNHLITKLYHGDARGIDTDAAAWAALVNISIEPCPADWNTHGPSAGPRRNTWMIRRLQRQAQGTPMAVVLFPGNAGTADMEKKAKAAGLDIFYAPEGTTDMTPDMIATEPEPKERKPKVAPPSAPMLQDIPPQPDDIADPPVPADVKIAVEAPSSPQEPHRGKEAVGDQGQTDSPSLRPEWRQFEPMLQGMLSYVGQKLAAEQERALQEVKARYREFDASIAATWTLLQKLVEQASQQNEHAQYQLADALLKLQEKGVQLRHDPYTATVQAVSPEGFPVTITLAKGDTGELCSSLPCLMEWLQHSGYTGQPFSG